MTGATVGSVLAGDVVRLEVAPLPAHVRTARLISAAVARRAGLDPALIDELKLAVGEACTRAVDLHRVAAATRPVEVLISLSADVLSVAVADRGPITEGSADLDVFSGLDNAVDSESPGGLGLALIQGLVDDVSIEPREGGGTTVTMRWPLDN